MKVRKVNDGNHILCQILVNQEWRTFAQFSQFDDYATTKSNQAIREAERSPVDTVYRVINWNR